MMNHTSALEASRGGIGSLRDAPSRPMSPVESALGCLTTNIAELEGAISTLRERLRPVSMAVPQPGGALDNKKPAPCDLLERVDTQISNIQRLQLAVREMIEGLQV